MTYEINYLLNTKKLRLWACYLYHVFLGRRILSSIWWTCYIGVLYVYSYDWACCNRIIYVQYFLERSFNNNIKSWMSFFSPFQTVWDHFHSKGIAECSFWLSQSPKKGPTTPLFLFPALEPDQCKANAETKERPEDRLPPHPHRYSLCHLQLAKVHIIYRLGWFCKVPVENSNKKEFGF